MKSFLLLPITLCLLFPTKTQALRTDQVSSVCESFAAGKIDAAKTLKALDLDIDDFSIGMINTVKIFVRRFEFFFLFIATKFC